MQPALHAAIRRERRAAAAARARRRQLPALGRRGVRGRGRHAADDFWACVYRLGAAALFDRDDGFGGHEAPFRFPHETHASPP